MSCSALENECLWARLNKIGRYSLLRHACENTFWLCCRYLNLYHSYDHSLLAKSRCGFLLCHTISVKSQALWNPWTQEMHLHICYHCCTCNCWCTSCHTGGYWICNNSRGMCINWCTCNLLYPHSPWVNCCLCCCFPTHSGSVGACKSAMYSLLEVRKTGDQVVCVLSKAHF